MPNNALNDVSFVNVMHGSSEEMTVIISDVQITRDQSHNFEHNRSLKGLSIMPAHKEKV